MGGLVFGNGSRRGRCGMKAETMQEGLKPDRKPLEVSDGTIDTILQRRAAGNISEVQVLALVILDQLQAQEQAAAS